MVTLYTVGLLTFYTIQIIVVATSSRTCIVNTFYRAVVVIFLFWKLHASQFFHLRCFCHKRW